MFESSSTCSGKKKFRYLTLSSSICLVLIFAQLVSWTYFEFGLCDLWVVFCFIEFLCWLIHPMQSRRMLCRVSILTSTPWDLKLIYMTTSHVRSFFSSSLPHFFLNIPNPIGPNVHLYLLTDHTRISRVIHASLRRKCSVASIFGFLLTLSRQTYVIWQRTI